MGTNQFSEKSTFTSDSDEALLVFGYTLKSNFKNPLLKFRQYNPDTGKAYPSKFFAAKPKGSNAAQMFGIRNPQHTYFVLSMPAGHWFLESIHAGSNDGHASYSVSSFLSTGTYSFQLKAGEATYIGEYRTKGYFSALSVDKIEDDFDQAMLALEEYQNVSTNLKHQSVEVVAYSCQKKKIGSIGFRRTTCDEENIIVR